MTRMTYRSQAETFVLPDEVRVCIRISKCSVTRVEDAIMEMNGSRAAVHAFVSDKASVFASSLHQRDVNVRKNTKRVRFWRSDNPPKGREPVLDAFGYSNLRSNERESYTWCEDEQFANWEASVSLDFTMNALGESVVDDLASIFELCAEEEFKCDYSVVVSDTTRREVLEKLYAMCIRDGKRAVSHIAGMANGGETGEVALLEIHDPAATSSQNTAYLDECDDGCNYDGMPVVGDKAEPIFALDLVRDLLRNEVKIDKSLDLVCEFGVRC